MNFNKVVDSIMESLEFDQDDYELDLMQIMEKKSSKCTKATKKAHSTRKGKKWMKCARQSDGSYKRIHWGQAGVRVGKDNPKRRKSFHARHKCSTAKAGTPKAAACADW